MLSICPKVDVGYKKNIGLGIANIDPEDMELLCVEKGDILEIKAKRSTYAICHPLFPVDENKGITRIDGLIRNNSGCNIGDTITINKSEAYSASDVTMIPLDNQSDEEVTKMKDLPDSFLKDCLEGIPTVMGDNITIRYDTGRLFFRIVDSNPLNVPIIMSQDTSFLISLYDDIRNSTNTKQDNLFDIINERYAKGEITREKFLQMKEDLE